MSVLVQSYNLNSNATKANPIRLTIPVNSQLIGIYSVSPNPIIVFSQDPNETVTFQAKYYWVPLGATLDSTQYLVGVAGGQSVATTQALVQDQS